jgi:glutathionyl-hydroquinone reductase
MLANQMANEQMQREMALYTHKTDEDIRKFNETMQSKIDQNVVKSELKKDEKATEAQVKAIYG